MAPLSSGQHRQQEKGGPKVFFFLFQSFFFLPAEVRIRCELWSWDEYRKVSARKFFFVQVPQKGRTFFFFLVDSWRSKKLRTPSIICRKKSVPNVYFFFFFGPLKIREIKSFDRQKVKRLDTRTVLFVFQSLRFIQIERRTKETRFFFWNVLFCWETNGVEWGVESIVVCLFRLPRW